MKHAIIAVFVLLLLLVVPSAFAVLNISINKTSYENETFLPSSRILGGAFSGNPTQLLEGGNITRGSTLFYQINITNNGDESIGGINVTDIYPAGIEFNGAAPAPTAGNNTWIFGALAVNAKISINISVNVSVLLANGTGLNNTANATFTNGSNVTFNSSQASRILTVRGIPTINITKTADLSVVNMNASLRYQIFVNNTGDDVAVNVTVVDLFPQGVNFTLGVPAPAILNNTWAVGNLTPGQNTTINITVNITGRFANATVINNSANATFTTFTRVNITNTSVVLQNTVRGTPFLVVTKAAPSQVRRGNQMVYNITINNTGLDTALNVTLIETYPQGVLLNSSIPGVDVSNTTWLLASISPGNITTVNITVNVSLGLANASVLTNTVNASTVNIQGNAVTSNYSVTNGSSLTTVNTTVRGIPSINITKADTPDPVNINAFLTYIINVTNNGDDTALNVTVMDAFPHGVNFSLGQPSPVIRNDTFSLSNMIPNQSILVNLTVNVTGNFANASVINNTANATFTDAFNTSITNTSAVQQTTVRGYPNLAVTKADAGFDPVTRFTQFNYTVRINNTGNDTALNVTLTETYPQGVIFVASQPAASVGNNTWALGNLSPGSTFLVNITLNYTGSLANGTVINNTVNTTFVNSQGLAVNSNHSQVNNSVGALENTTTRGLPNQSVIKSDSADPVTRFTQFNYTVRINNTGDDTAVNVTLVETYPEGVAFVTAVPAVNVGNNTWTLGNLSPGGVFQVNITLEYNGSLANATVINNSVNVTLVNVQGSSVFTNSTIATQNTTTRGRPLLSMNKTDSSDPVARGGNVNYTITISNAGDDTALNVSVVESYAQGLFLNSSSPAASVGNATFNIGNLTVGNTTTINITLNVSSTFANATVINNSVNASFVNIEGRVNSTVATQNTTIRGIPNINVTKFDSPDPVTSGTALHYIIEVNNTGDDTAFGVNLSDAYPSNVVFADASLLPNVSNNFWIIGTMIPNQSIRFNISVDVKSGLSEVTLNNTVFSNWSDFRGTPNSTNASTLTSVVPVSASGGGSGGGGGGGSSSSTTTTTTEEATPVVAPVVSSTTINSLELRTVRISDAIVSGIVLIPNSQVGVPIFAVSKISSAPVGVESLSGVYGYLSIEATGLDKSRMNYIGIKFSVPKEWLKSNGFAPEKVVLNRLVANQWTQLFTSLKSDAGDHYEYEAKTPGFSTFAITGKPVDAVSAEPTAEVTAEPAPVTTTAPAPVSTPAQKVMPKKSAGMSSAWWTGLIVLVAIIVIIVVWRNNKQKKYR